MQVVFDDDCLSHNPPYETLSGFRIPYYESPARYRAIKATLARSDGEAVFTFIKSDPDIEVERYISSVCITRASLYSLIIAHYRYTVAIILRIWHRRTQSG